MTLARYGFRATVTRLPYPAGDVAARDEGEYRPTECGGGAQAVGRGHRRRRVVGYCRVTVGLL